MMHHHERAPPLPGSVRQSPAQPGILFFRFASNRSLPELRIDNDEEAAFMFNGVVILPLEAAIALEALRRGLVAHIVVARRHITGHGESRLGGVEILE